MHKRHTGLTYHLELEMGQKHDKASTHWYFNITISTSQLETRFRVPTWCSPRKMSGKKWTLCRFDGEINDCDCEPQIANATLSQIGRQTLAASLSFQHAYRWNPFLFIFWLLIYHGRNAMQHRPITLISATSLFVHNTLSTHCNARNTHSNCTGLNPWWECV